MKFMALMLLSFDTTFKCDVQAMGFQNQVIEIIIHKKKNRILHSLSINGICSGLYFITSGFEPIHTYIIHTYIHIVGLLVFKNYYKLK